MKRGPETTLTPNDLNSDDSPPETKKINQTQKQQRIILKVKNLTSDNSSSSAKKIQENQKAKSQVVPIYQIKKHQNIFGTSTINLFGTSNNPNESIDKQNLFSTNQSIFNNPTELFNKPTTGLFGTPSTGLFGIPSTGLFGNTSNKSDLFSNTQSKPISFNSSIFSNISTGSTSLFQNLFKSNNNATTGTSSIFDFSKKTPQKKNDSDEEGGQQSQHQHKSEEEFNPAKSTGKYEYKSPYEKKIEKKVLKYKKGNGELVENLDISIQQLIENREKKIVIIRLPATKNILYQGILMKQISTIRNLHNKQQNIQMKLFSIDQKTKKLVPDLIKIQFNSKEDAKQFTQLFNSSII